MSIAVHLPLPPLRTRRHTRPPHPHTPTNRLPRLSMLAILHQREMQAGLTRQRIPDLRHALGRPTLTPHLAQRVQQHVIGVHDDLLHAGGGATHDDIHVFTNLLAEGVEGKVVDVVAEGVLDLAADQGDAEDYVRSKDASRNRDITQQFVELEGEQQDVDPCYLADGDAVRDGEGRVEDAVCADEHVVEGGQRVEGLRLVDGDFEGAVVVERFHVRA